MRPAPTLPVRCLVPLPAGMDMQAFPVVDISVEQFDGDVTHSADSVVRGTLSA